MRRTLLLMSGSAAWSVAGALWWFQGHPASLSAVLGWIAGWMIGLPFLFAVDCWGRQR